MNLVNRWNKRRYNRVLFKTLLRAWFCRIFRSKNWVDMAYNRSHSV